MKDIVRSMKAYAKEQAGVVAVVFGIMVPVIIGAVGISIDVAQSYLVRDRLTHAVDAAALAAAASSTDDPDEIEARVNDFIEANYPPDKVGFTVDINVDPGVDTLGVNATARLETSFMKLFGVETIDVYVETEVRREVKAIEVALVMDVTGSMSTNNNIGALRTAATNFVNVMFERTNDLNYLKIGLVPFSTSVNVGPYGVGLTPGGQNYGLPFVDLSDIDGASNRVYYDQFSYNAGYTANRMKWGGCVLEGAYPDDVEDHDGPWKPYRYCRNSSDDVVCDSNNANSKPNYVCPRSTILPLSNNKNELLSHIQTLEASGNTYVNIGLVWGLRVLSPDFPFMEGVEWADPNWKKAVILMTDGENQAHPYYSAYGRSSTANMTNTKLNNRVLDVCDELKAKGTLVYTITFYSNISNSTKNIYKQCATQPSMWYDAPTQAKLIEVYGAIAKELSNLHITK